MEYYDITSALEPREVLRYLNNLGIHNISGEVLKYFITDLKKFIKYDLQKQKHIPQDNYVEGPERLHSASTFSSRIRSKVSQGEVRCSRECRRRKTFRPLDARSAPNLLKEQNVEKPIRRSCSCVKVERKAETVSSIKTDSKPSTISSNLIKVPKQPAVKKCDPVSLYHHYTALWAKYKPNVPGENDWSELRWMVRQKMAGNVIPQSKVPERSRPRDSAKHSSK